MKLSRSRHIPNISYRNRNAKIKNKIEVSILDFSEYAGIMMDVEDVQLGWENLLL